MENLKVWGYLDMYNNNQGAPQYNDREKAILAERSRWTYEMSRKCNTLFVISIISLILSAVAIIMAVSALTSSRQSYSDLKNTATMVIIIYVASLILSIFYGATILSMGTYMDDFSSAGGLYIGAQICSFLKNIFGSGNSLGSICNLVGAALSIVFILKFSAGMINCFDAIDNYMAGSWESFKTTYLVGTIGTFVSALIAIMPGLTGLGFFGVIGFAIMMIIVGIWQIVLLRQSANEFAVYSNSPKLPRTSSSPSGSGVFHNVSVSPAGAPPVRRQAPRTSMSRTEAVQKAEEMRRRREAKANGEVLPEPSEKKTSGTGSFNDEHANIQRLKEYKELLDSGILTQEEFDAKKKELLGN